MNKLPERINVMKVVSYDVTAILEDMGEPESPNDKPTDELTVDDLLDWIAPWVSEDFGTTRHLIYQDEDGNEL